MTPVLIARTFGPGIRREWAQMAAALERSARQHCPGWHLDIRDEQPAEQLSSPLGNQGTVWNTHKLDAWVRAVDGLADGTPVLLIDADTLILRPLDPVWDPLFDLAYTVKPKGARFPFNGGVIFLRVSPAVRAFLEAWRSLNRQMLDDAALYQPWRRTYGGVNQSALGKLLKDGGHALTIVKLPCVEWNCEDASWDRFDPAVTRILHIKDGITHGNLRKAIFGQQPASTPAVKTLAALWHDLEAKAADAARRTA